MVHSQKGIFVQTRRVFMLFGFMMICVPGCGGGSGAMTDPRWGEVEVFISELTGPEMAAQMSPEMMSGEFQGPPPAPNWNKPSVKATAPRYVEMAKQLQANIPERLQGDAAVKTAVDKLVAETENFQKACEGTNSGEIESAFKSMKAAATELANIPGVAPAPQ